MSQISPASSAATGTTSTSAPAQPPSGTVLLSQVGSVLAGILLLILFVAWLVRKLGLAPHGKHPRLLKTIASCPLGQRERVVIVEVEQTWLVLGVTAQQITTLHTLPAQPLTTESGANAEQTADFRRLLAKTILKRPEKSA